MDGVCDTTVQVKRVYKVVQEFIGKWKTLYYSASLPATSKYCIEYKLDETARAPIGGIYVFPSLVYAEQFRLHNNSWEKRLTLLECEATGLCRQHTITVSDDYEIAVFWNESGWCHVWTAPTGSYIAETVTPRRAWDPMAQPLCQWAGEEVP